MLEIKLDQTNIKKNNKYTVVNELGKQVYPYKYKSGDYYADGDDMYIINDKGVLVNITNKIIIEDKVELSNGLIKGHKLRKWGVISKDGDVIIPFEYSSIDDFKEGIVKVCTGEIMGKMGYYDIQGNVVIPLIYPELSDFHEGRVIAKKFAHYLCYSFSGDVTVINDEYFCDFDNTYIKTVKVCYWGALDQNGKIIIPFDYDKIEAFTDNKAIAQKNKKWGVINLNGSEIIPFEYDKIEPFVDGKANVLLAKKRGVIDDEGRIVTEKAQVTENGFIKGIRYEKWGVCTANDDIVIPFEYDYIDDFVESVAKVKLGRRIGLININGEILIEEQSVLKNGLIKGRKLGQWGICTKDGDNIVPYKYDVIEDFVDDKAKVKMWDSWGYIDLNGNEIIPTEYDIIEDFVDGRAKVKCGDYWGYIDMNGNQIIPIKYSQINDFVNERAKISIYQQLTDSYTDEYNGDTYWRDYTKTIYGYIDINGNEILIQNCIDERGNEVQFSSMYIAIKNNTLFGCIDDYGNEIVAFKYSTYNDLINSIVESAT